jgi:hypothetical protein
MRDENYYKLLLFLVSVSFMIYVTIDRLTNKPIQQQAIERGYALYCPKDGKFAWKGECDE